MEEVYENDYELLYLIRQKDEMALAALMHKYEEIADKLIKKYIGACKSGLSEDDYLQLALSLIHISISAGCCPKWKEG